MRVTNGELPKIDRSRITMGKRPNSTYILAAGENGCSDYNDCFSCPFDDCQYGVKEREMKPDEECKSGNYYILNREKILQQRREYYQKNKEKIVAKRKARLGII
ncbi:MAG: hypothetical protein MJ197_10040 [Bacteroidales bacterium]|nr:hypothetical protein [Bacteroidales bacterium]